MKLNELITVLEQHYPPNLAESWDNVGLLLGDPNQAITRVMTTLDVLDSVVQEAIDNQVHLIISHHPLFFNPVKNLNLSDPMNQMYAKLIKHNIAVYSMHTNLDKAKNGLNDWLASQFDLQAIAVLIPENDGIGLGRMGQLPNPVALTDLAQTVKKVFHQPTVHLITSNPLQMVQKVAIIGGAGGSEWQIAQQAGADVLITADIKYHQGQDIMNAGFTVIDPTHYMENIMAQKLAEKIYTWQIKHQWDLDYINVTHENTSPFMII